MVQKQKVTAISSAESEYRAAVTGISEICWIRRVMKELKMKELSLPSDLLMDNQAAIHMLQNAEEGKVTRGKKHIELRESL